MEGIPLLEAAQRLNISERTLRRHIKAGKVKAEKKALEGGGTAWEVFLDLDNVADSVPDKPDTERHAPDNVADSADALRMKEMRDEIIFLRGIVEQQQRAEAELRAALRESLKALPKALNEPARAGTVADNAPDKLDSVADNMPTAKQQPPATDQQQQTDAADTSTPATNKEPLAIEMQAQNETDGDKLEQIGTEKENAGSSPKSTFISRILRRVGRR